MSYTLNELMVVAAAREIKDGEVVFVGMRLPLIAFVVAKKTHAPNAVGLFENGVIRSTPSPELIYTMADPPNIKGATQCLDMASLMGMLQSGRVNLGFLVPLRWISSGTLIQRRLPPGMEWFDYQVQAAHATSLLWRIVLCHCWNTRGIVYPRRCLT